MIILADTPRVSHVARTHIPSRSVYVCGVICLAMNLFAVFVFLKDIVYQLGYVLHFLMFCMTLCLISVGVRPLMASMLYNLP